MPDEVKVIASGAFKSGVQNVIFRSTSSLAAIENYAFAEATSLSLVGIYIATDDFLATLDVAPDAFANSYGLALVNDNFVITSTGAVPSDYDSGAMDYIYGQKQVTTRAGYARQRAEAFLTIRPCL